MSKKMSLTDVKEVRRIITNLLTDSVKSFSVISVYHNRSKAQFSSRISYGCCHNKAVELVNANPLTQELLELQTELYNKYVDLRKAMKLETDVVDDYAIRLRIKPEDHYSIVTATVDSVEAALQENVQDAANTLARTYNKYMDDMEARTFDAYTKGMSADDFLNIIKDEIAEIKTKIEDLRKEIEKNGYKSSNTNS